MRYLYLLLMVSFSAFSYDDCSSKNLKDLEGCTFNEYKSEDAQLNFLYKTILTTYPELKESIRETQRAWVKARDNICEYSESDGQEFKVYKNYCLYEQTYERNRELKAILTLHAAKGIRGNSDYNSLWGTYLKHHCKFMKHTFSDNDCMRRNEFLHEY